MPYHQLWPTNINPSTSLLYTKLAGGSTYIIYFPKNQFSYYPTPANFSTLPIESVPITVTRWLPFAAITQYAKRSSTKVVPKAPHPTPPHCTSPISAPVNTRSMQNTPITITKGQCQAPIHSPSQRPIPYAEAPPQSSVPVTTQTVCSYNSFQDHLQSLPSTETFFLGIVPVPPQLHKLVSDIHNSRFAMASDGSVRASNGSFAWVLYGTQSQIHLTGHNTLTGGHSDLSTFRAEACGYLGALYALKAILTNCSPLQNSPHITSNLHIDNLGVVKRSQDTPFSIQQCLQPDWDIMHKAYKVRTTLPATITVLHVQSHQDETSSDPNSLSLPAHLNIFADSRTHKAYKDCPHFHQTDRKSVV